MSVAPGTNVLCCWIGGPTQNLGATTWSPASRRFSRRLQTRLDEALEEFAVSYAQHEVMEHLAERPNLHGGELARRLRLTRQSAHALLKQLARADLIDLLPPDLGARPARLTANGRRRLEYGREAVLTVHHQLESVPAEKRLVFLDSISALDARIAPSAPPPPVVVRLGRGAAGDRREQRHLVALSRIAAPGGQRPRSTTIISPRGHRGEVIPANGADRASTTTSPTVLRRARSARPAPRRRLAQGRRTTTTSPAIRGITRPAGCSNAGVRPSSAWPKPSPSSSRFGSPAAAYKRRA